MLTPETPATEPRKLSPFVSYRRECLKSIRDYFLTHCSGEIKIISVVLLILSFVLTKKTKTASVFIPVVLMIESFLFFFFIFANILAFPRYLTKLIWPIFDMLNDFCAFIYLAYVGFYSIIFPPGTMDKLYWQVTGFILSVAFLSLLDVVMQTLQLKFVKIKGSYSVGKVLNMGLLTDRICHQNTSSAPQKGLTPGKSKWLKWKLWSKLFNRPAKETAKDHSERRPRA